MFQSQLHKQLANLFSPSIWTCQKNILQFRRREVLKHWNGEKGEWGSLMTNWVKSISVYLCLWISRKISRSMGKWFIVASQKMRKSTHTWMNWGFFVRRKQSAYPRESFVGRVRKLVLWAYRLVNVHSFRAASHLIFIWIHTLHHRWYCKPLWQFYISIRSSLESIKWKFIYVRIIPLIAFASVPGNIFFCSSLLSFIWN